MTLLRLGRLLRERRGGRGIREVAEEIGISPATLTRVEAGRLPDLHTFKNLCTWLKVNPAEILGVPVHTGESLDREQAPAAAAVHLRADQALPPTAASDLAQLIVVAHRELARRVREGLADVPTGF